MSEQKKDMHVGMKSFILMLGLLLSTAYTIFEFFFTWLPAETITPAMIQKIGAVWVILLILWIIITYIAHMLWKLVYHVEEKYLG